MSNLIKGYRFLGQHRHLRRMRKPWIKLKFAIFLRLVLIIIVMMPFYTPIVLISAISTLCEIVLDKIDFIYKWIYTDFSRQIGLTACFDREEQNSRRVYRWRRKMRVGIPKIINKRKTICLDE